jgi:hypothetical protein
MTRTIRRTIVVEYGGDAMDLEKRFGGAEWTEQYGCWFAWWPKDAEILETVEEITEDAGKPSDGVSGRVDQ